MLLLRLALEGDTISFLWFMWFLGGAPRTALGFVCLGNCLVHKIRFVENYSLGCRLPTCQLQPAQRVLPALVLGPSTPPQLVRSVLRNISSQAFVQRTKRRSPTASALALQALAFTLKPGKSLAFRFAKQSEANGVAHCLQLSRHCLTLSAATGSDFKLTGYH